MVYATNENQSIVSSVVSILETRQVQLTDDVQTIELCFAAFGVNGGMKCPCNKRKDCPCVDVLDIEGGWRDSCKCGLFVKKKTGEK